MVGTSPVWMRSSLTTTMLANRIFWAWMAVILFIWMAAMYCFFIAMALVVDLRWLWAGYGWFCLYKVVYHGTDFLFKKSP
jgi:hypothetical protein